MPLTDLAIRQLKPGPKDTFIADGGGLYLRLRPNGTKTWVTRTRTNGKARWKTLGRYPQLSLASARSYATQPVNTPTIQQAFDEYYDLVLTRDYQHPEQVRERMNRNILAFLGTTDIALCGRAQISNTLLRVVARGSPVAANRTLADVKNLFRYAVSRGWLDHSPVEALTRRAVGGKETSRSKVLSTQELSDLIKMLRTDKLHMETRLGLALLLITGQRASEVLGLTRGDVSGCWWTIPAQQTKSKRPHKVYLSPQARVWVRTAFNMLGDKPFSITHRTFSRALLRGMVEYTPHDLRRTFASRMSDAGVTPHVIEKCLNHKMEGVMAVYNRAEYLPERVAAWRQWGVYLATLRREVRRKE